MGKATWLVLLLLVPIPASPPGAQKSIDEPHGVEWVLDLGDETWSVLSWSELVDQGVQPLRHLSPHRLLVWSDEQAAPLANGAVVERVPSTQWRGALDGGSVFDHDAVRLVLEPNLPVNAKRSLYDGLRAYGDPTGLGLDTQHPLTSTITLEIDNPTRLNDLFELPGVAWIEPVLLTSARNGQAASLSEHGSMTEHPFWRVGLDGTGVVLGVADSGLDADHACFRNATDTESIHAEPQATHPALGLVGPDHRKILAINTTVDDNDTPGHTDYRHGTHVAGTLVCRDVQSQRSDEAPRNGSALAHGATMVFQDIVNEDGWNPPPVDELLAEASQHGVIVHSNSWGDDTTAYTSRTGLFDAYAVAVPWSLAFIAPGNAGEGILEPANGRNVVAVSATSKASDPARWGGTSYGPTEAETNGIFLLAPGQSIQSAAADGFLDTNNNNLRSSSGTSMATPLVAGGAGLVQQMYQQGWILGPGEPTEERLLSEHAPTWSNTRGATVQLGQGFAPSGSLLRATLALATSPLSEEHRDGGDGGEAWRSDYDGWGVFNLSRLFNPEALQHNETATPNLWVHDSFRLNGSLADWTTAYLAAGNNVTSIASTPWYGEDAAGPFLQTGDRWERRFTPMVGEDVRIRMAFPAKPEPMMVDDLQLKVHLSDGRVLLGDHWQNNGTPTVFSSVISTNNVDLFPASNETTVALNIPASMLDNATHFDVEIVARFISHGNRSGAVGLGGDSTGFALVVDGVDRDTLDHDDDDLDGVANVEDQCPEENAAADDVDNDGCLDDDDEDGVANINDACPDDAATGFDLNVDGCLDDSDADGVTDDLDLCVTVDLMWPVNAAGCYPVDRSASVLNITAPANGSEVVENLTVQWTVLDPDGDALRVDVLIRKNGTDSSNLTSCQEGMNVTAVPSTGACRWRLPTDLPPYTPYDQTYDVIVLVRSLNQSPAADRSVIEITAASNLTFRQGQDEVGPLPASSASAGLPVLALTILAVAMGVLFMRWVSSGPKPPFREGVKPPFATEIQENINNSG